MVVKRFADRPYVAFVSFVTIRQKVVGLLEVAAVDFVPINKPRHVYGVLGFEF